METISAALSSFSAAAIQMYNYQLKAFVCVADCGSFTKAVEIFEYSEKAAAEAKPFMDLWYQVNEAFPGYKLHIVPFENNICQGCFLPIQKFCRIFL